GKLYEYLAARRPILALAEPSGETAAVLRQTPAGIVVSPDDEDGLRQALATLVKGGRRRIESDPAIYDGALRAAEIAAILHTVVQEAAHAAAAPGTVSVSTKQS